MAVMGSSGSGKTTLLDSLAGRLASNVIVTGSILMDRKKRNLYSREVSYVAQEELLLGTLSVRETLTYSANMRLPSKMRKEEINKVVEETIMKMGLEECADNTVDFHDDALSNIPASTGYSKVLLEISHVLPQFYYLGNAGDQKLSGEQVLTLVFGVPLNHGKWWDLTALFTLLLLHRLILFLVLRYYKRPRSTMLWFYAKERIQLTKECLMSTNKRYISSKNKAAPHPLSSQEGLMSPNFAI
ncbi:unnamed protein product [Lupinus luteus]|uniref:ABC transporter domain-containing protein n=1 Tax=Lupinus luteus TaxID=3873 RepID=A0AAV1XYK9_LUPLU